MAKKKGLAAHKRAKKNTDIVKSSKVNPPPIKDLMEFVIPGFVGYAGTRMASRVVHGMALNRYPRLAKHASVLSTGIAAAGAWLLVHRVEKIQQYHTPVVVGASIAAIQTVVQAYLPKYGWMVSDHNMNELAPSNITKEDLPEHGQAPRSPVTGRKRASSALLGAPALVANLPSLSTLSTTEVIDEIDDLDLGSLSSGGDEDYSDLELDIMTDEASLMN